ncbi:MAG TPA: hypothetical protein PLZ55_12170, partial [bacterium]|nr:hypothetical protein [bacterium]
FSFQYGDNLLDRTRRAILCAYQERARLAIGIREILRSKSSTENIATNNNGDEIRALAHIRNSFIAPVKAVNREGISCAFDTLSPRDYEIVSFPVLSSFVSDLLENMLAVGMVMPSPIVCLALLTSTAVWISV